MSLVSDYMFHSSNRLSNDSTDNSQRNLQNVRFANYQLSEYFSETLSNSHVSFATQQPAINFNGKVYGNGLNGTLVDVDSTLLIKTQQNRPLEKLQLSQRPFLTIPYLGKGSCDSTLESQLLQGELSSEKKSVSTIMEKSFMGYTLYPVDEKMKEFVENPSNTVEEAALKGWTRGGVPTREIPF